MPAEWERQSAVWLAWSDEAELWPGNIDGVERAYTELVKELAVTERVRLLVQDESRRYRVRATLSAADVKLTSVELFTIPYDDCWMRDNGPIFLTKDKDRLIVDWGFNGWGDKFGPYDRDDEVPVHIARELGIECVQPGLILEGGSIETNGQGTLLTSEQCLLNPNRNGEQSREDIEPMLLDYFGARKVIWLNRGLIHDHTDGHIDNIARFVAADHVLLAMPDSSAHPDYDAMRENQAILRSSTTADGEPIRVTTIPLPLPTAVEEEWMSPSPANYILGNGVVVMPTYDLGTDERGLETLKTLFPYRRVVGLPALDILRGGGSFHCISQQEPAA
jgi:agmatine deiminase